MTAFPGLPARAPLGHRSFAIERQHDESGVSGVGVVLEGVVFGTGVTVVHWLQPPPRGSINVFDSFEQFMSIHVGPHPSNQTRILWSDGSTWEPGDYPHAPTPWAEVPRPAETEQQRAHREIEAATNRNADGVPVVREPIITINGPLYNEYEIAYDYTTALVTLDGWQGKPLTGIDGCVGCFRCRARDHGSCHGCSCRCQNTDGHYGGKCPESCDRDAVHRRDIVALRAAWRQVYAGPGEEPPWPLPEERS